MAVWLPDGITMEYYGNITIYTIYGNITNKS